MYGLIIVFATQQLRSFRWLLLPLKTAQIASVNQLFQLSNLTCVYSDHISLP